MRALGQAAVHVNRARLPYASESELTHGDLLAVEAPTSEQGAFNHTLFFTFVALAGSGQSCKGKTTDSPGFGRILQIRRNIA